MDSKRAALDTGDGPVAKRNDIGSSSRESSPGDGNQISLAKHVAPFTGNGCSASLESYLYDTTPAGSQLLSWSAAADGPTSDNDAELEKISRANRKRKLSLIDMCHIARS